MRSILGILLLLAGAGFMSCRIEVRSADLVRSPSSSDWVRTVDGWERPRHWSSSQVPPPAVHPVIIAAGQVLVSLFALTVATNGGHRK
jgi:hypothetical protein